MKRIIMCPLIAVLAFSGCTSSDRDIPSTSESSVVPSTSISEVSAEETSASTTFDRTQELIDSAWEARLEYDGSGLVEIPELLIESDSSICISDISIANDAYTELSESIDEYEAVLSEPDDSGYIVSLYAPQIWRCDNRVVSLQARITRSLSSDSYFCTEYMTWNYRGEILSFSDVIRDYDVFINTVSPLIQESLDEIDDVDAEEIVSTLIYAPEGVDFDFYMTDDSLCFFVDYYTSEDNGNVLTDSAKITIPYREYADLFEPEYLPGDGLMMWFSNDEGIEEIVGQRFTYDEYYNDIVCGTFVNNLNGRDYIVIWMQNSEAAFEVDIDLACADDYQSPILAVYDIDAAEVVYSEPISWGLYDRYNTMLGSFSDTLSFIEDHV